MSRFVKSFGATTLVVGLMCAAASPAFSVEPRILPEGDALYAMPCDPIGDPISNLNSIASNGASSGVGTALNAGECFADGGYNVVDGYYYAYNWEDEYFKIDVETGVMTGLGELYYPGAAAVSGAMDSSFVDNDGNHYLFNNNDFWAIDLSDNSLTIINADLPIESDISAASYNPVNEKYYVLTNDGPGGLWEINLSDGTLTFVGQIDSCDGSNDCWGLDFDSNGVLWIEQDGQSDYNSGLVSTTLDDLNSNFVLQGVYTDATTGGWYGESSFLIRKPAELAETGFDPMFPLGIAGAATLAGAMMIMRRRAG